MPSGRDTMTSSLREIGARDFGEDEARHLLWRAGFGGSPSQVRMVAEWGPRRAVDHLLGGRDAGTYPWPREDAFDGSVISQPTEAQRQAFARAARSRDEDTLARLRLMRQEEQRRDRAQMREIQRWWLKRMIESPYPLEEKMTLFWHGHFATSYRTIENSYHLFLQNQLFRRHAAGNFGTLLRAIIRDPAMLKYLDNDANRRGNPNENLARELMELFGLGVGGYTERDIKEGARALTGYTFEGNAFAFRSERHDAGPKTILGRTGNLDGDGFVDAILSQRRCGQFIAAKLYRFFVGDIPARGEANHGAVVSVVNALATTLAASRYEIAPVLRRLFLSEHFYDGAIRVNQIKSPVMLVVGAVRSLDVPVRDLGVLCDALDLMGQNLFFPPSVKGWDGGRAWINSSTLFVRQNILAYLLTGRTPTGVDALADQQRYDVVAFLDALVGATGDEERRSVESVARAVADFTLGRTHGERRAAELVSYLRTRGDRVDRAGFLGALALLTAMPEYQLA